VTNTTPIHNQPRLSLIQRLSRPAAMVSAMDYHRVQLLSSLILIFILVSIAALGLALLDQNSIPRLGTSLLMDLVLSAVLLLIAAFVLNRTKYYGLAPLLIVSVFSSSLLVSCSAVFFNHGAEQFSGLSRSWLQWFYYRGFCPL